MREHDRDDTPRASASTYNRYLAGLADIGQVPFLFRFNAFPEAHLDSLENPAYATEFRSAEGRVFVLPTFRGGQTLQEYQSAFGPGGSLPSDYSISPQISYFTPADGLHLRRQRGALARGQYDADFDAGLRARARWSTIRNRRRRPAGVPASTFYSGALVAARQFGANSFGLELASSEGHGFHRQPDQRGQGPGPPGRGAHRSTSDISQTRFTAGFSRDLSRNVKLGLFYRYAFIRADDHDVSHTINNFPPGLNATLTTGHSSEFGAAVARTDLRRACRMGLPRRGSGFRCWTA